MKVPYRGSGHTIAFRHLKKQWHSAGGGGLGRLDYGSSKVYFFNKSSTSSSIGFFILLWHAGTSPSTSVRTNFEQQAVRQLYLVRPLIGDFVLVFSSSLESHGQNGLVATAHSMCLPPGYCRPRNVSLFLHSLRPALCRPALLEKIKSQNSGNVHNVDRDNILPPVSL